MSEKGVVHRCLYVPAYVGVGQLELQRIPVVQLAETMTDICPHLVVELDQ